MASKQELVRVRHANGLETNMSKVIADRLSNRKDDRTRVEVIGPAIFKKEEPKSGGPKSKKEEAPVP